MSILAVLIILMISCGSTEKKQKENQKDLTEFEKILSEFPDLKLPYTASFSDEGVPLTTDFESNVLNENYFYFDEYSDAHTVVGKFSIDDDFYGLVIFWLDFEEDNVHLLVFDKEGTLISDLQLAQEYRHNYTLGTINKDLSITTQQYSRVIYENPDAVDYIKITYSIENGEIIEIEREENFYNDEEDLSGDYKIIVAYAQDWSDTSEDWSWFAYMLEEKLSPYGIFVIGNAGKKAVLDEPGLYWEMDLTEILEKNNVGYYCYIFYQTGKEPLYVEYSIVDDTLERAKEYFGL